MGKTTTTTEQKPEPATRPSPRNTVKPVRKHIKILIIDDDESVCDTVRTLLERHGFQIKVALTPEEGVQNVAEESFHLTLVDQKMPRMDGVEVCQRILEIDPHVACMMMTAYPDLDTATAAMRAGCRDYIIKPFKEDQLLGAIDRICRQLGLIYTNESELNRQIGQRIRQARLAQNMTLRQLSDLTDLTTSQLSQVELGKNAASIWALARICSALGYQISKLIKGI